MIPWRKSYEGACRLTLYIYGRCAYVCERFLHMIEESELYFSRRLVL